MAKYLTTHKNQWLCSKRKLCNPLFLSIFLEEMRWVYVLLYHCEFNLKIIWKSNVSFTKWRLYWIIIMTIIRQSLILNLWLWRQSIAVWVNFNEIHCNWTVQWGSVSEKRDRDILVYVVEAQMQENEDQTVYIIYTFICEFRTLFLYMFCFVFNLFLFSTCLKVYRRREQLFWVGLNMPIWKT